MKIPDIQDTSARINICSANLPSWCLHVCPLQFAKSPSPHLFCPFAKSKVHVTWKVTLQTCKVHSILLTCPNAPQALQNFEIRLPNVWNLFLHFPHFCSKKDCPHLKHFMGCLIKRKIQPHFFGLFDGQLKLERGALSSYPLEFLSKNKIKCILKSNWKVQPQIICFVCVQPLWMTQNLSIKLIQWNESAKMNH